jgi:mannonate dehydratase
MPIPRRKFLSSIAGAGILTAAPRFTLAEAQTERATRAMPIPRIKDISVIECEPQGVRLTVVKITTDQDGLYGYGCATFTQRADLVRPAVERYLKPFLVGKTTDRIEDIWQSCYDSSYWKNGPVLNNAISGIDQALWDIKGRQAGMPIYQLAGGKCREAADAYAHASGAEFEEVVDNARKLMAQGFRNVRVQVGLPGMAGYGSQHKDQGRPQALHDKPLFDRAAQMRRAIKLLAICRHQLGDEVELLHDMHERVTLNQAINLGKALEPYRLFFLEDPLPPEDNDHFRLMRQQTSIPIAMGELFNTQHEYMPLIKDRLIDFIRIHISQIGGLSPARKVAALSEFFGVRTAWHGPGDASPLAHAAQLALELASYNFGVHEGGAFPKETKEVFVGCPEIKNGYMLAQERPGLGIEVDEKLAARFPIPDGPPNFDYSWGTTRRQDGTVIRP